MPGFFEELKRRNVFRAAAMYVAAAWALSQGLAQLGPFFGAPDWTVRWFVIACAVGFPFWIAFAWFYAWTPQGLKRESEVEERDPGFRRAAGRKLDFWIIGVMAIAIVLLVTNQFVLRRDATSVAEQAGAKAIAADLAKVPQMSVAVLPLANASPDKDQVYFSDGLSEDLINTLSQFQGLKVISAASSFRFRNTNDSPQQVGAKLGVAHLVEGSVQHAGDMVRITVQLVKAADGSTLWSEHYDRPYKDLFALQDTVTKAIATALQAKLLPGRNVASQSDRPPSGNLAAYNAFLQGKFYGSNLSVADLHKASGFFHQAIALDPGYAAAYALLAFTQVNLGMRVTGSGQQDAFAAGRAAAAKALALAPDLGAAHQAYGYVLSLVDRDVSGALVQDRRGLALDPHSAEDMNVVASDLAFSGQLSAAVNMFRNAIATDPMQALPYSNLSIVLSALGRLDEAEQAARQGVALKPTSQFAHEQLATVELLRGNTAAALEWAGKEPNPDYKSWFQAAVYIVAKDHARADGALETFLAKYAAGQPYLAAQLYALRGQPDAMFQWLDKAAAQRDPNTTGLLADALLLRYRHDPRFAAFCKRVGLPATTDAVAMP